MEVIGPRVFGTVLLMIFKVPPFLGAFTGVVNDGVVGFTVVGTVCCTGVVEVGGLVICGAIAGTGVEVAAGAGVGVGVGIGVELVHEVSTIITMNEKITK